MRRHIDLARRLGRVAGILAMAALAACGGSKGPDIISPTENYIPDLDRVFQNRADTTHTFQFVGSATNVQSGQLVPNSKETLAGAESPITGTFNGRTLTFRIARSGGPVDATGTFRDDNTIELRLNNAAITLDRFPPK